VICALNHIQYLWIVNERTDKRITISLAEVIWAQAEFLMERKGFNNNFSAYLADLVRRDHERFTMTEADRIELLRRFNPQLNEPGTPYAVNSPAPGATAVEAAAAALVARGAATLGPTPAAAAPSASASAPAAAGQPRRGGRPKPPVRAPK
jgi:hypothetical protein